MGCVLFFVGQSANNAISDTVRRDAACLAKRGKQVTIVDLTQPLELPEPADVDMIVSYQAWGHDLTTADGHRYADLAGCPFIVVLGDHPIHHAARILACPKTSVFCVGSQNQMTFLRDVLNVSGDIHLLPAGMFAEQVRRDGPRDIGALVIGHAQDPAAFLAAQKLPPALNEIIAAFAERPLSEPDVDPIMDYMRSGFDRVMQIVGNESSAVSVGRLIDLVSRRHFRWRYFQVLRKMPVTFVGDDWEKIPREGDDAFTAQPSIPFKALAEVYARARICLNLHPPYYDFHERLIDAMTQGAAVATPETALLQSRFDFGQNILALPVKVEETGPWLEAQLSEPAALATIGQAGREIVEREYGYEKPVDLFLGVLAAKG